MSTDKFLVGLPIKRRSFLPPANITHWVASRKASIVLAMKTGTLSRAEARLRYGLSDKELDVWERTLEDVGIAGLRVTRTKIYKKYRLLLNN